MGETQNITATIWTRTTRYYGHLVEYAIDEGVTIMDFRLDRDVELDMRDVVSVDFDREVK